MPTFMILIDVFAIGLCLGLALALFVVSTILRCVLSMTDEEGQ